ncbi:MAG: sigma-E factor negative regulatory protein [Gammaproteobacteria bacterium]|nr:sigma-E factor negative regulatory protein [Gammaproteobacteria bacterium]
MSEHEREQLSAFMDGQPGTPGLTERLGREEPLRATWARYHLIRDAMQHELSLPSGDLASRISLALEVEPTILAPKPRRPSLLPGLFKQAASFAVAASVTAAVIFGVQGYNARQQAGAPGFAEQKVSQPAPNLEQPRLLPLAPMAQAASARNQALDPRQQQLRNYLLERSEQAAKDEVQRQQSRAPLRDQTERP